MSREIQPQAAELSALLAGEAAAEVAKISRDEVWLSCAGWWS